MRQKEELLTDAELAQLAAERLRARVEACGAEIAAVLEKHRCTMQPVFEIRQGQVSGRIEITPLAN
jgi:hypothetical protein